MNTYGYDLRSFDKDFFNMLNLDSYSNESYDVDKYINILKSLDQLGLESNGITFFDMVNENGDIVL